MKTNSLIFGKKYKLTKEDRKRRLMKWFTPKGFLSIGWKIVRAIILIGCCFIILYPFIVKGIDAFKSFEDYLDPTVKYVPKYFTLTNLKTVINRMQLRRSFLITGAYSALIGAIQVLICSMAGYGLARFKFKGNKLLFGMIILVLLVPPQTLMISYFAKFRFFYFGLNLVGGYWPYIIMALTGLGIKNGLYIFMFRQNFKNMPKELEDAALVDGCGAFGTFFRVMLPNTVSLIVTVFLMSFAWQWTDSAYTTSLQGNTDLLVNLAMGASSGLEEDVMIAQYNNTAAVLAVLPIMLVYFIGQRFFVQGVERSGITG